MNGTSDSRTYKRNRIRKLNDLKGACGVCGPHSGCNRRRIQTGRKNKETK